MKDFATFPSLSAALRDPCFAGASELTFAATPFHAAGKSGFGRKERHDGRAERELRSRAGDHAFQGHGRCHRSGKRNLKRFHSDCLSQECQHGACGGAPLSGRPLPELRSLSGPELPTGGLRQSGWSLEAGVCRTEGTNLNGVGSY